ncbi:MAG: siroheme decarboxylase subunit beta [Planctomycetota bacterium]|jgi:DNA-binding Lrp family transcriptional regulator
MREHAGAPSFSEIEERVISALQGDNEVGPGFFEGVAERLGVSLDDLFACIQDLKAKGFLKRIGAVVRHQRLGYNDNFLVALCLPPERIEEAGEILAAKSYVSHCYERDVPPEFPFNLFAMVHATSFEEAETMMEEIRDATKAEDIQVLRSLREVKKESMKYF